MGIIISLINETLSIYNSFWINKFLYDINPCDIFFQNPLPNALSNKGYRMVSSCQHAEIMASKVSLLSEGVMPPSHWFCGKNR